MSRFSVDPKDDDDHPVIRTEDGYPEITPAAAEELEEIFMRLDAEKRNATD
jgi:hypothetical protein